MSAVAVAEVVQESVDEIQEPTLELVESQPQEQTREEVAVERIEGVYSDLERLFQPRFAEELDEEFQLKWRDVEVTACEDLFAGEAAAWELVFDALRQLAPMYVENTRVLYDKLKHHVLPPDVKVEHGVELDKADRFLREANELIKSDQKGFARRKLEIVVSICRRVFAREAGIRQAFFAGAGQRQAAEAAQEAAKKARYNANRADRAEENRERARNGKSGTKVAAGGRR